MRDPVVFIFVLCLLCDGSVMAPTVTHSITCSAGSCEIGQPTSVMCHFHTDVHASKLDFFVTVRDNNHVEKSIVMCNWDTNGTIYCVVRDGFHFDTNKVNNRVVIDIPSCQEDHLGLYKCHVISEVGVSTEGCKLTVKENDPSDVYIRVVVYVFVFVLGIVILAFVGVRLANKRKSTQLRNTSGDAANASNSPIDNLDETCNLFRRRSTGDAENSARLHTTSKSVQTQISLQMSNVNQATQTMLEDTVEKDPYRSVQEDKYREAETKQEYREIYPLSGHYSFPVKSPVQKRVKSKGIEPEASQFPEVPEIKESLTEKKDV